MKEFIILDFGTSKIKTLRYKYYEFGDLTSELDFIPVSIGKLLSNNIISDTEKINILQDFETTASLTIDYFFKKNSNIKIIATEIFRRNKQLKKILKQICGKFKLQAEILSPRDECRLLANNFDLTTSSILLDIGGGSVNVIYKLSNQLKTDSYHLGAYVLNNLFQPNDEIFDLEVYHNIDKYIKNTLFPYKIKYENKFSKIIVGSNQMLSFFNSLSDKTGLKFMKKNEFNSVIVDELITNIFINTKYENQFKYFEKNQNFMYGADKMLVILKNFIEITGATTIAPTDDSISSGLAKVYIEKMNKHKK